MKYMHLFLLFLTLPLFVCGIINGEEIPETDRMYREIKNGLIIPYTQALKAGDVNTIKRFLSEEMYEKNKVLLEQNKEYPDFLRKFYQDINFRMGNVTIIKNDHEKVNEAIVDIEFKTKNGNSRINKLRIKRGEDMIWKVMECL